MDIIVKSVLLGYDGFYINEKYENLCKDLEIKAKQSNILTSIKKRGTLGIYITNMKSGRCIDIVCLGILKTRFEYY